MAEENMELTNNLENLLSPFCYEPETALPKTIPEVPGGMYLSGFISQDCSWGCCFNHSVIKCFPVDRYFEDSHTSFAAHSSNTSVAVSSSSYTFIGGHITCAAELAIHNLRTSSGMRKLLLGISYTNDGNNKDVRGAVVLFDPIRCAPMKWIEIPDPVSSITVLSHFEEGGSNRPFFNETMMAMVGIAAVGLRGGSVIIIDLGLDDPNLSSMSASDGRSASDSTYRLLYVNPHEYVIATKRHKAVSKRSLISLRFANEPEDEMIADAFYYCKPNGETVLALHKNSVAVTCLEYVPAIGSLLVGFTCGGFQIWRVNNMELQFSSEPLPIQRNEPAHVFGFSFQQPVDDPKNYCYIWVMYGNKSAECTTTHVELHSLYYERKNYIENFGFVYDGFKQCAKRMSIPLVDDFLSTDSENEDFDSIRCSARPIRIWTQPDSDLMYCTWEVGRGGIFYLGAFDLNQWYSNHTKEHIFYNPESGLCPYWVALPIEIADVSNFVMDVRILPKSLMRWENPHTKLDVHLFPASLSFRAICLTNTGVSAFEHFGVQEKLVRIILKDGPSLMIQPENIKNSCTRYGLEPVFPHVYGEHLSKKEQDRYFILTVLLENRRTPAIIRLANVWLDGSYANVGCTIDLIIDWIGGYMFALRGGADEHWQNLFDFADDVLPPETVRFINFSNFAWTSLHRLLLTLMGPTEVYSVRRQELENMEFGLGKLVQYSAALLMMYKARLLPECDKSFIKNLSDYYEQRRHEARNALQGCDYIDNQFKRSHPLMIDHLMDNLMDEDLREKWHIEERQYCYPPQHVGYLVNMFMSDADPKAVSRIFMYFLIDLTFLSQNADTSHSSAAERKVRGDFKAVMDSTAEEYQEIYVLWLLDHGIPNEILVHLKENDRLYQKDGLPWCAAAVALTAAGYENDVAELLLKSCPHSLARLLFSLMTSSISKYTSLAELMISSNLSSDEHLLQQFFEISESRERLAEFIRLKSKELPESVRSSLLAFLNSSESVKRLSQLLMYYVHTEDYKKLEEEFVRVREILKHKHLSDNDRKMWRFQETYFSHLLNSRKGSNVQQFLRLQSHQNIRSIQNTISIKPVPATDVSPSNEMPNRGIAVPKLPPHLRRIKLNETIAQDPLSPLRRYAGRIQRNVCSTSESDGEKDEFRSRRISTARKSFSQRMSMSVTRHSFVNNANTTCNESLTIQDKLNTTSKNSHIDLISLLKTPAVDHRKDKQRTSFSGANQSISQGLGESLVQTSEPPRHSIMKEVDPSKPKINKKVELRFENLSLSSEEGEDKNVTIYEDADDNLEGENDNNFENAVCDVSFSSAVDKSLFESESAGDVSLPHIEEAGEAGDMSLPQTEGEEAGDTSLPQTEEAKEVGEKSLPLTEGTGEVGDMSLPNTEGAEEVGDTSLLHTEEAKEVGEKSLPHTEGTGEGDMSLPQTEGSGEIGDVSLPNTEAPAEAGEIRLPIIEEAEEDGDTSLPHTEEAEEVGDINLPHTEEAKEIGDISLPHTEGAEEVGDIPLDVVQQINTTPTREAMDTSDVDVLQESNTSPTREAIESSDVDIVQQSSTTLTRETMEGTDNDDSDNKSTRSSPRRKQSKKSSQDNSSQQNVSIPSRRTGRSTRSTTPTRDAIDETVLEVSDAISTRSSTRSKTPTREVTGEQDLSQDVENVPSKRTLRATRSTTPTRSAIEDSDLEVSDTKSTRSSIRSTRSKTPTREATVEQHLQQEVEKVSPRRSLRATRSTTPTRMVIENPDLEDLGTRSRRVSTRSTRSTTPTREISVEPHLLHEGGKVSSKRSSRDTRSTTPTREVIESTDVDDSDSKSTRGSTRSKRSKKSSQDSSSQQNLLMPSKRTGRSTRSTTPTRDAIEDTDLSDAISTRSSTRSIRSTRSKTPTREITGEQHLTEDAEKVASRRTLRATRSTTPTREAVEDADVHKPETKTTRRTTRSTRSKTPTRDAELKPEDSPTKVTKQKTRTAKRSYQEASIDDVSDSTDASDTKTRKKSDKNEAKSNPTAEPGNSSSSSFVFEITQEDMEEEMDEVAEELPSTSKKQSTKTISKARKHRLKYLRHQQDLSTVIEDSETERSEVSVFETTLMPAKPDPPKNRRIKGIKVRPVEEETAPESEPPKPSKRRKAAVIDDFFDEEDEDAAEVESLVSNRSTRSTSSRRSTGSAKAKTSRRKGRSSSKSTT